MGYSTDFYGRFDFNKALDDDTYELLQGLATTRRMKRNVDPKYGTDGEFYIEDDNVGVLDYNNPPSTQPGLWLQWIPTEDRLHLEWDGGEKFYSYDEWLEYLIKAILSPRGYTLNGTVKYQGEEYSDHGTITITNNVVVRTSHEQLDAFKTEAINELLSVPEALVVAQVSDNKYLRQEAQKLSKNEKRIATLSTYAYGPKDTVIALRAAAKEHDLVFVELYREDTRLKTYVEFEVKGEYRNVQTFQQSLRKAIKEYNGE
jgi:hypothetical protein